MDAQNWSRNPIIAVMEMVDLVADLLYKHNCVIVPGLGGFVSNYSKAEYKEEYHTLQPARKRIAFNERLHENDGLLVNHVAKSKRISYAEAETEVNHFAEYVTGRIRNHKSFEFKNVGTFYYTRENNLVFVPYEGLNMFPQSYGLAPLKLRPAAMNQERKEQEVVVAMPKPEKTRKVKQARPSTFKIQRLWPVISGAAVILFIAISIQFVGQLNWSNPLTKQKAPQKQQDAGLLHFDSQPPVSAPVLVEEKAPAEESIPEVSNPISNKTETVVESESSDINASEMAEKTSNEDPEWLIQWQKNRMQSHYYIVIASGENDQSLMAKSEQLQQLGYSTQIIQQNNQSYLSIEKFSEENNAQEYLRLIKRSFNKAKIITIVS